MLWRPNILSRLRLQDFVSVLEAVLQTFYIPHRIPLQTLPEQNWLMQARDYHQVTLSSIPIL